MSGSSRRQLIGRGVGIAGLAALPHSLITAELALAQESDETDALERLVVLEQAAELAYSLAVEDGKLKGESKSAFEEFGRHSGEHATALEEAMDQLAVDPPDPSDDPADYDSLADFDASAAGGESLDFAIALEEELIAAYESETPALEAEDLVRTGAQVAASHAQHLVALRLLASAPATALTKLPEPADASGGDE